MAIPTGIDNLFRPTKIDNQVSVGDLISFRYALWKNDPHPIGVVDKIKPGVYVRGVNIHYLPFNNIRTLFGSAKGISFNYQRNIKGDPYLASSLRTYKYAGIDLGSLEILDSDFIMQVMSLVRTFDPMEIDKIRQIISEQLNTQVNPRASDITTNALAPPRGTTPTTPGIGSISPTPGIGPTTPTPTQTPGSGEL
jgi:hypothetical protein